MNVKKSGVGENDSTSQVDQVKSLVTRLGLKAYVT